MKILPILLLAIVSINCFANIGHVQFDKVPNYEEYWDKYNFIRDNEMYYNHWQPDWTYDISKKSLVKELSESYDLFSKLDHENLEVNLLLGDISHYLFNLHEEKYYETAVKHYQEAMQLSPNDYRPLWFIANHYALSNVQDKSIEYFIKSQNLLPVTKPADYWAEYSFATAVANMPSHCIYAMDQVKAILGKPGYFEEKLGANIRNRIVPVNKDSVYNLNDIWTAYSDEMVSFVCRPIGLKFLVDSTWQVNLYDYQKHQTFVTIVPPAIKNKEGREITYTIAMIIRVAQSGEELENYVDNFIAQYPDKNKFDISDKYPGMISFEIKNENMYQDMGGAHMHMVGIKRERPKYAGLLLEQPMSIHQEDENKLTFYRARESKDRFDGDIYYAVMLDACEDIYDEAYRVFKEIFEKQLIIE